MKICDFYSGRLLSLRRNNQKTLLYLLIYAPLKVIPSYIITSYLAGDHFQVLRISCDQIQSQGEPAV